MSSTERAHSGTAVAAVILAAMIAGLVYRYWPSDEHAIRRHLSNLAEALSRPAAEQEVLRLTRLAALREYFAPEVRIRFDEREIAGRDPLLDALQLLQSRAADVLVEFADVRIKLADDAGSATVQLTARVSSSERPTEPATVDMRSVAAHMAKRDGDWLITAADATDAPSTAR